MKKILFLSVFVILLFLPRVVNAAFSDCSNPVTGCRTCSFNTSTSVCSYDPTFAPPSTGCAAGAQPPANMNALCNAFSDASNPGDTTNFAACEGNYVACVGTTVPNGGFFCNSATSAFPACTACDNDPATADPACPGGTPPFANAALCHPNCDQVVGNYTCVLSGGVCKSMCASADNPLINATCQTGVCCRPPSAVTDFRGSCFVGSTTVVGISTAIGCIPIGDLNSFATFFLSWGMGIAGGIGFLMLIFASFQIMTSAGDPKRLQTGRELLMSAVSGIILLVFSVFVLRVLGVNILGIF